MFTRILPVLAIILIGTSALTGCANTIRGVGRDVANTADATQDAARSVDNTIQKPKYRR